MSLLLEAKNGNKIVEGKKKEPDPDGWRGGFPADTEGTHSKTTTEMRWNTPRNGTDKEEKPIAISFTSNVDRFHRVGFSLSLFLSSLPSFPELPWLSMALTGLQWVKNGFYWNALGSNGFKQVSLGCDGLL